jgi:hypothetical protein
MNKLAIAFATSLFLVACSQPKNETAAVNGAVVGGQAGSEVVTENPTLTQIPKKLPEQLPTTDKAAQAIETAFWANRGGRLCACGSGAGGGGSRGGGGGGGTSPGRTAPTPPVKPPKEAPEPPSAPTVRVPGMPDVPVYRGGNRLSVRVNTDIKVDPKTGQITSGKDEGVSLSSNASSLKSWGGAYEVQSIPPGLTITQTSSTHYVIAPAKPMTLQEYQRLLGEVRLVPVSKDP